MQALAEAESIGDHRASYRVAKSNVGRALLLGIVFGVFTMFFFEVFPGWAEEKLALVQSGRISGNALTSILIAFGAVTAYPMSFLPSAFLSLETRHKVFGIGLFFSGVELAPSVWDVFQVM
ncbi:MAG: hypothetical protein AAGN35_22935 [Bacteroidota bacterium]